MFETKMKNGWKFWPDKDAFALVWNIPEHAREITLPHDAMLEQEAKGTSLNKGNTGYRDGENYNYVTIFYAPKEYKDQTVMLKFEGVYMNAFVYVNGQLAGKNPFGYTTFFVPLNDFLQYGQENEIRVVVRNGAMTNSRWYSGGGIYRDVYLLVAPLTHFIPEGVQIVTENLDKEEATIRVATEIKNRNHMPLDCLLETTIEDADGIIVAVDRIPVSLYGQEERTVAQRIWVDQAKVWDCESPYLYQCTSKLYQGEQLLDKNKTKFGIRTLQLDAKHGLRVNGTMINLRGACIHHDSGLLGAATYEDAQYRQVQRLKEAGFNGIRMSHHPMAPAMLRACDELGMYVMDEAFDMWTRGKSDFDYSMFFQEWWEKDVTAMVRKDFNHPCVIMYSLGNEIPEVGTNQGAKLCHEMATKVKELDPTRYTLVSINGVFAAGDRIDTIVSDVVSELKKEGSLEGNVNHFMALMDKHMDKIVVHKEITKRLEKACAPVDIAGYNYMTARYESDGKTYPNRIMVGSETYPPDIARNWGIVKKNPQVIGDFTWTGWDYIGEAGVGIPAYAPGEGGFGATFPCQLAYCGDIDITGFRRPASYFREVVFGLRTNPYITVCNPYKIGTSLIKTPWVMNDSMASWTYPGCEGNVVTVEVYAQGDEVELWCNDRLLEKKVAGEKAAYRTIFEIPYEPGTLQAISYENGKKLGCIELKTVGETKKIGIEFESIRQEELLYLSLQLEDEAENAVTQEELRLEIEVEGDAVILGFGSGSPKSKYNYIAKETETFNGRALAILKKEVDAKIVTIIVRGYRGKEEIVAGTKVLKMS